MLVDTVEIDSFHYWDHVSVFFLLAHGWALDNNGGPESAARREGVSWLYHLGHLLNAHCVGNFLSEVQGTAQKRSQVFNPCCLSVKDPQS